MNALLGKLLFLAGGELRQLRARCSGGSLSVASLLLVAGCSPAIGPIAHQGEPPVVTSLGSCPPMHLPSPAPCVKLTVSALPPLPDTVSEEAKEAMYRGVATVAYRPLDGEPGAVNPGPLVESVKEVFEEFSRNDALTAPIDWSLERTITVAFSNEVVVTLDIRNRGYLGGAHGFDERWLLPFWLKDGRRVLLEELIDEKSQSLLATIVEAEFRRSRSIPTGKSLEEAGFSSPTAVLFTAPQNFGVLQDGILLRYNPYDIAPYSFGATEVLLQQEAVVGLLKTTPAACSRIFGGTAPGAAVLEGAPTTPPHAALESTLDAAQ